MKNIYKKSIVISIILLLIGVSVSSAISIDNKPIISNNESVEDCGCNEVSATDLVKVERLRNKVEVYSKLLLVLSKYNPELREMSEELSNEISTFKDKLTEQQFLIICSIVYGLAILYGEILKILSDWIDSTEEGSLEREIAEFFYEIFLFQINLIFAIGYIYYCWPTLNLKVNNRNHIPF